MNPISSEQLDKLIKAIKEMSRSEEQFVFLVFKNQNGTDNVSQYSFNMPQEKLEFYLKRAFESAVIREGEKQ